MTKRYAIVRVDDKSDNNCKNCEMLYTNDNGNNDCRLRIGASFLCDRYGDTKEQLTNKIETAIKRKLKGGYSVTYRKFGKVYIKDSVSARELAESIVEFLGVE